jgi:hypothetical protein
LVQGRDGLGRSSSMVGHGPLPIPSPRQQQRKKQAIVADLTPVTGTAYFPNDRHHLLPWSPAPPAASSYYSDHWWSRSGRRQPSSPSPLPLEAEAAAAPWWRTPALRSAPVLTVKFRQPSHEFTFSAGMTFIPYPLVLTPLV